MKYNALYKAHYNAYDIDFIRNLVHTIRVTIDVTTKQKKNPATTDTNYLPYTQFRINGYRINYYSCIDFGSFDCILST